MTGEDRQRIDKWLWFARLAKTRTAAQKLAVSGHVRVNRDKNDASSRAVKAGDILTVGLESGVRVLKIVSTGIRRGPPAEARNLYEDLSPPAVAAEPTQPSQAQRDKGSGRPTKRDRRALDTLQEANGEDFPRRDD